MTLRTISRSIPFLDYLLQELSTRFSDKNCIALKGMAIVPVVLKEQYKATSGIGKKHDHKDAFPIGQDVDDCPPKKSHPVAASSSTSEAATVQIFQHKGKSAEPGVWIQRIDRQWQQSFCTMYVNDLPSISSIFHKVDNWEST